MKTGQKYKSRKSCGWSRTRLSLPARPEFCLLVLLVLRWIFIYIQAQMYTSAFSSAALHLVTGVDSWHGQKLGQFLQYVTRMTDI
jgi:hypothetical protein